MAEVAETAPNPSVPGFLGIFAILEDGALTTPCSQLEILATLPLGDKPPLVVCLEAPEPHIRVLWGAQFVTPSFAQPTPEDRKVLAFDRDICLVLLPETVVAKMEWLTPREVTVSQAADMVALISHLTPGHPLISPGDPKTRHDLSTLGVPGPPLPGPPADSLPFPRAGYCMSHDARKIGRHGDEPAGGTVPRLVDRGYIPQVFAFKNPYTLNPE